MRTLLINPDSNRVAIQVGGACAFPMGLGYIAAVLEKDHEVFVIDNNVEKFNNEELKRRIKSIDPEIVGITSDTVSLKRAIEIANCVKAENPLTIVVIGGAHVNAWHDYVSRSYPFSVDVSVYGEGEDTAVELWDRFSKGVSIKDVLGISYPDRGHVVTNPPRDLIKDINVLPLPARHLFPMKKYPTELQSVADVMPIYSVNTSRGCPFSCKFCSSNIVFGRKYRARNPESIVDEIEFLVSTYGAKGVYFREDLFTTSKIRVMKICEEIVRRGLDLRWFCESRVDTVDEELLCAMRDAGCGGVWFGVEKGTQYMLDYINKQVTIAQIETAFSLCKKVGIKTGASFMIGIPGETWHQMDMTVEFAKKLKADSSWFCIFVAYPTSELYEQVVRDKLWESDLGHGMLTVKDRGWTRKQMEHYQKCADRAVTGTRLKIMWRHLKLAMRRKSITKHQIRRGLEYLLGRA